MNVTFVSLECNRIEQFISNSLFIYLSICLNLYLKALNSRFIYVSQKLNQNDSQILYRGHHIIFLVNNIRKEKLEEQKICKTYHLISVRGGIFPV